MAYTTEILSNGTKVFCSKEHRFGTDALLLSRFYKPHRNWLCIDLCSGCGIVALDWHDTGHKGECTAIEISPIAHEQLKHAIQENNAHNINPICADLRTYTPKNQGRYDLIACNPPYFELQTGEMHSNTEHARARHEQTCTLNNVCDASRKWLKDGGRLILCHRPTRLAEVFETLKKHKLEPKRLAFVKNQDQKKPWLFLVEAHKNRKVGLIVEQDIIIKNGEPAY